jgi:hypothetical protein
MKRSALRACASKQSSTEILERVSLTSVPHRVSLLPWQERGLSYTRSGYGRKIPTHHMVQLSGSKRWRRVYACVYSNSGTCYVPKGKDWIVILPF